MSEDQGTLQSAAKPEPTAPQTDPRRAADKLISGDAELLFRQVNPAFIQKDRITSAAFKPTKKDNDELSVSRGTLSTAEEAYLYHTGILRLKSEGSWATSIAECSQLAMSLYSDPRTESPENPAHAFIDFQGLSNGQKELKAGKLRDLAVERGKLHPPNSVETEEGAL